MSTAPVVIVAPTDPQIDYIANLCAEHGWPAPAVYSKLHASLLIGEMRSGQYRPISRSTTTPRMCLSDGRNYRRHRLELA